MKHDPKSMSIDELLIASGLVEDLLNSMEENDSRRNDKENRLNEIKNELTNRTIIFRKGNSNASPKLHQ